jgi:non-structural maintenance of chromosomes element 4
MASDSTGLRHTLQEANRIFNNVKQTSDAAIDSRLLVSASDLSARRSNQLKVGGAVGGIDVDGFINRCIGFMRRGPNEREALALFPPSSTQASRHRDGQGGRQADEYDSGGEDDEGEAMNWEWLGRRAAFPHNLPARPAVGSKEDPKANPAVPAPKGGSK